jgi:hypothetical protein
MDVLQLSIDSFEEIRQGGFSFVAIIIRIWQLHQKVIAKV